MENNQTSSRVWRYYREEGAKSYTVKPWEFKHFRGVVEPLKGLSLSQARHIVKALEMWERGGEFEDEQEHREQCARFQELLKQFREWTNGRDGRRIAEVFKAVFIDQPIRTRQNKGQRRKTADHGSGRVKKLSAFTALKGWEACRFDWCHELQTWTEVDKFRKVTDWARNPRTAGKYLEDYRSRSIKGWKTRRERVMKEIAKLRNLKN